MNINKLRNIAYDYWYFMQDVKAYKEKMEASHCCKPLNNYYGVEQKNVEYIQKICQCLEVTEKQFNEVINNIYIFTNPESFITCLINLK